MENLMTKEDFWDEIEQKCPSEFYKFVQWIDKYKKLVHWGDLFPRRRRTWHWKDIKFHHLPDAMQVGVFYQYVFELGDFKTTDFEMCNDESMVDIIDSIAQWFELEEKQNQ
jgi:hypothetical protein